MAVMGNFSNFSFFRTKNNLFFFLFFVLFFIISLVFFSSNWFKNNLINNYKVVGINYFDKNCIDSTVSVLIQKRATEQEIKGVLLKYDFVQDCNIIRKNANELIVEIKERVPLFEYVDSFGKTCLVDSDGKEFYSKFLKFRFPRIIFTDSSNPKTWFLEKVNLANQIKYLQLKCPKLYWNIAEIKCKGDYIYLYLNSTRTILKFRKENFKKEIQVAEDILSREDFFCFLKNELDFSYEGCFVVR